MGTLANLLFEQKTLTELLIESGGEVSQELEDRLRDLDLATADKVDAISYAMDALEDAETRLKAYKDKLDAAIKTSKRLQESLKYRVKDTMTKNGIKKIEGNSFSFTLGKLEPKLEIDKDKEAALIKLYNKEKIDYILDKDAIESALEIGIEIDGARLVDVYTLRKGIKK